MPVKSKSQLRRLAHLREKGDITDDQWNEYTKGADLNRLPERVRKPGRKPRKVRVV